MLLADLLGRLNSSPRRWWKPGKKELQANWVLQVVAFSGLFWCNIMNRNKVTQYSELRSQAGRKVDALKMLLKWNTVWSQDSGVVYGNDSEYGQPASQPNHPLSHTPTRVTSEWQDFKDHLSTQSQCCFPATWEWGYTDCCWGGHDLRSLH